VNQKAHLRGWATTYKQGKRMLNKAQIIGRLGADVELSHTKSGVAVTSLRVATDESYKNKQGEKVEMTEWHRVNVFDRLAELCAQYLHKGSLIYVEGKLSTRKYQDKNGQDAYSTEIRADQIRFLDPRGERENKNASAQPVAPHRHTAPSESFGRIDDIPF
jgi:single-strand DNA-binding protein